MFNTNPTAPLYFTLLYFTLLSFSYFYYYYDYYYVYYYVYYVRSAEQLCGLITDFGDDSNNNNNDGNGGNDDINTKNNTMMNMSPPQINNTTSNSTTPPSNNKTPTSTKANLSVATGTAATTPPFQRSPSTVPTVSFAKSLLDLGEFERAAHALSVDGRPRDGIGQQGVFVRAYSLFLGGEKKKEEEVRVWRTLSRDF